LEQNQQKLLRLCSIYTNDADDAKDLFQEVLIHICESMSKFNAKSSLGTWMYRITLNVCLRFRSNNIKKQNRFINLDIKFMTNIKAQAENHEQNDKLTSLRSCIKRLNEADKAVVLLYLEEMPYKEISNITGLTENSIAVKLKKNQN